MERLGEGGKQGKKKSCMATSEPQRGAEGLAKSGSWRNLRHPQVLLCCRQAHLLLGDCGTRFLATRTQSAPHPDFCSSFPKIAMLCSKLGGKGPRDRAQDRGVSA